MNKFASATLVSLLLGSAAAIGVAPAMADNQVAAADQRDKDWGKDQGSNTQQTSGSGQSSQDHHGDRDRGTHGGSGGQGGSSGQGSHAAGGGQYHPFTGTTGSGQGSQGGSGASTGGHTFTDGPGQGGQQGTQGGQGRDHRDRDHGTSGPTAFGPTTTTGFGDHNRDRDRNRSANKYNLFGGTFFDHRPDNWNDRPRKFNKHDYNKNVFSHRRFRIKPYHKPRGWYYRRWVFGDRLPFFFWTADYYITDWWLYGLPIPPVGCEWVRVGNDALLIDIRSGIVLEVVYEVFW